MILLFAFGTATAMVMPIGSAIIGLAISLSVIRLLENVVEVPSVAATLATMIGLGVGIDYALFIVTRHKLQLGEGMELRESIARATATAGGAVVFAGFTVVIALCSLAFAGIPLVSTLGFTAAIAVVVAVFAAATLLPAMLGALGPHINSLRVPFGNSAARRQRAARLASLGPGGRLPALALGAGGPRGPRRPGAADLPARARPERPQRPAEVDHRAPELRLDDEGLRARRQRPAADHLQVPDRRGGRTVAARPRQSRSTRHPTSPRVSEPTLDKTGTVAVFTAISKSAPWADETVSLVEDLRETTIPNAVKGTDGAAYVGGQTAGYIDLATEIADKLPLMIGIVVALSFIVLLLAFRSLLVPVKAAAMNLLSVAAAYGVVTAVFQLGWGASLIGLDHSIPIVSFVPLLMFAILFGLSMDYEVFLLTQMREHYRQNEDEKEAVIEGLANTGRVITSAAAIMVCVFTSFVLNGNPIVKEFGVGLAVAIAIDSTLVRCLLVPAVMVLLGRRAWWMPRWMDRIIPHISIEGEEYFAKRDAAAADGAGQTEEMFPLNLPNALTLLRILAVPVVVVALLGETPNGDALAAAVFALAALTDGLDGYFARSRDAVTTFGKLMDPIADKLLIAAALISLVSLDRLAAWVAMVIIAREFAVTVMRAIAVERGIVISASWLGKVKTVLQIAAVFALIAANPAPAWVDALVYLAVAATVISGADYFFGLRKRIEEERRDGAAAAKATQPELGASSHSRIVR